MISISRMSIKRIRKRIIEITKKAKQSNIKQSEKHRSYFATILVLPEQMVEKSLNSMQAINSPLKE